MTNVVALHRASSADDEAAAWIIRLDAGPLSPTERQDLQAWLTSNSDNPALLDDYARVWTASGSIGETANTKPTRRIKPYARAAVAASVLAVVGLAWFVNQTVPSESYRTAVGETSRVVLSDGSSVLLNTNSHLKVRYSDTGRELKLERGEAFFDVAYDPSRPFDVLAAGTVTRAVGTRFAVRTLGTNVVSVVVTDGRITFGEDDMSDDGDGGRPTPVAAGERAVSRADRVLVSKLAAPQIERATAWMTGGIVFQDERLADVLEEVNRYSNRTISVDRPALGELRVSGYMATDNVEGFVSGLAAGTDLNAVMAADGAILLTRD